MTVYILSLDHVILGVLDGREKAEASAREIMSSLGGEWTSAGKYRWIQFTPPTQKHRYLDIDIFEVR